MSSEKLITARKVMSLYYKSVEEKISVAQVSSSQPPVAVTGRKSVTVNFEFTRNAKSSSVCTNYHTIHHRYHPKT